MWFCVPGYSFLLEETIDLIEKNNDMINLCPDLCIGEVCTDGIRLEGCLGDGRGRESTWSQYQLLNCSVSVPPWSRLGQHISYWPLSLVAEMFCLVFIIPGWCNRYRLPHKGANQFMGVLALLSWMSVIVVCVYKYKILFLFNVIDYSRFLKSVFFYVTLLPCISITCAPSLPPIKERTSICKAVDTIREACCHGFQQPVTIIVVVFCIAW